jgi:uncharacterized membrane protein YphA (DoxX/SURF4 family)
MRGSTTMPGPTKDVHGAPTSEGRDPRRGILALRIGIGIVWALNLIFVFDPANGFFSGFSATAGSFGPSSLGGAGFPQFVATYPMIFSVLIAGVTLYLAVAFLFGVTTRWACVVGAGFAVALLISQFGSTFFIPGGTDVGPMPIYVAVYFALFVGHAGREFSLDAWWSRRHARKARTTIPEEAAPGILST